MMYYRRQVINSDVAAIVMVAICWYCNSLGVESLDEQQQETQDSVQQQCGHASEGISAEGALFQPNFIFDSQIVEDQKMANKDGSGLRENRRLLDKYLGSNLTDAQKISNEESNNNYSGIASAALLLSTKRSLPEFISGTELRSHHRKQIKANTWDVKTIHLKRNSYDYDVIERRKHHFVRKIIHDMGNYLILYDIKGVALSALPLYSLEQLDSMIEKYGLNAASNISEDVCEGT